MMNYREQFEKETGKTTGIMFAHSVGFRNEYVLWLESKLSTMKVSEEVIRKWELILQQDESKNILYNRTVIEEILADFKFSNP